METLGFNNVNMNIIDAQSMYGSVLRLKIDEETVLLNDLLNQLMDF